MITASVTKGLDTVTGKLVAVAVSAIISAIIVGGKAALKNLSITKSTELVIMFSKVLSELLPESGYRVERLQRRETKEKKKRKSAQKIRIRQCALIYLFYKNST